MEIAWIVLWPVAAAAFAAMGGIALAGLPGALMLDIFAGAKRLQHFDADGRQANALLCAMSAPLGVMPPLWLMNLINPGGLWWQYLAAGAVGYLLAGAVSARLLTRR